MPDIFETTDAPANTSTAYALQIGQTAQGTLNANGDHDWYRLSLTAGQTYAFALVGTGTNNVQDTYLYLRNSAGNVITSDDDSGPGTNATIIFTASTTGTYYLDAGAYNNQYAGQYGLSASLGTRPNFDIPMGGGAIDANASWSAPGTHATVTYGFRQSAPTYDSIPTFTQCSAAEMMAVGSILQLWSDVCDVTFVQVNPGGYTDNATILIGNYNDPNDGAGAYAYYPGSTASSAAAGDLWLNLGRGISTSSIPMGSYSWFAIMHELGHALGLSHPGDYNAGPGVTITYSQHAQFVQDTEQYSVMSYFAGSYTDESPGAFATANTPLLFDVYELQQIYGANTSTRTDDTIYGFNANAGPVYSFVTNTAPKFCIWDAGGIDTLDCSGFSQSQLINLSSGSFSNIGGQTGSISIALGATIENATGGTGNDTITGNSTNNTLRGGGGTDTIDGGSGWDRAIFSFASTSVTQLTQNLSTLTWTIGEPGQTETLTNVEVAQFSNGVTQALRERPHSDFDSNNCSDILWRNTSSGAVVQWTMNDRTVLSSSALGGEVNWSIVGSGDFNGDGYGDLLWCYDPTGAVVEWEMNGATVLSGGGIGGDASWGIAGTGDFNGDGRTDILWRNAQNGTVVEWDMDGRTVIGSSARGGDADWEIAGTGDFNGDGKTDLLWRYNPTGAIVEWDTSGQGGIGGDLDWSVIATGDFSGDGKTDILWRYAPTGAVVEWDMNGRTVTGSGGIGGDLDWSIAGAGDFNGDGRTDVLWRHAPTGTVIEWDMNGRTVVSQGVIGGSTSFSIVT